MILCVYAYVNVKYKPPAEQDKKKEKAPKYTRKRVFLGTVKSKTWKGGLKKAHKRWPEHKPLDVIDSQFVIDKKAGKFGNLPKWRKPKKEKRS